MRDVAAPDLTEAQWQRQVTDLALLYGWWWWHVGDSRSVTAAGWPDLVILKPPRLIYAELKTRIGRIKPEQMAVLGQLRQCGQEVALWRPRDLSTVIACLGPKGRRADLEL